MLQTLSVGNPYLIFFGIIFLVGTVLTFWTTIGGFLQVIGSMGFLIASKPTWSAVQGDSGVVGISLGALVGTIVGWMWVYYFMRYRIIEVVPTEDHLWVKLVDGAGNKFFGDYPEASGAEGPVPEVGARNSGPIA